MAQKIYRWCGLVCMCLAQIAAHAIIQIDVVGSGNNQIPLAMADFAPSGVEDDLSAVIKAD